MVVENLKKEKTFWNIFGDAMLYDIIKHHEHHFFFFQILFHLKFIFSSV